MTHEELMISITDTIVNGISDHFKDHPKAPQDKELRTLLCAYAVKISDIYHLLEEKPDYWFDPSVIEPLTKWEKFDEEFWLFSIQLDMNNLAFLKDVIDFNLTVEDKIKERERIEKEREEDRKRLEEKRAEVRSMMREMGLLREEDE